MLLGKGRHTGLPLQERGGDEKDWKDNRDGEAKFWLEPELELAKNHGYSRIQLKQIESIVEAHSDELVKAWRKHFSS